MTAEKDVDREDKQKAVRLVWKRAVAKWIAARGSVVPPDFDEEKELLNYLDEKYGV